MEDVSVDMCRRSKRYRFGANAAVDFTPDSHRFADYLAIDDSFFADDQAGRPDVAFQRSIKLHFTAGVDVALHDNIRGN